MDIVSLRSVSFLRELSPTDLTDLIALMEERTVPAREVILEEGGPVAAIYIVLEGAVHARRRALKRNVLLGRLGVGSFFGELNLFDYGIATATVTAAQQTRLAVLPYAAARAFMEQRPAAGYHIVAALLREVSRRLRLTNERLVHSVFWNQGDAASAGDA